MTTTPVEFTPWTFLTLPLDELCELFDARLIVLEGLSEGFQAAIDRIDGRLFVIVPDDDTHNRLQCETAARAVLARWFDVDVTNWPMELNFYDSHDGETWEHHDLRTGGGSK